MEVAPSLGARAGVAWNWLTFGSWVRRLQTVHGSLTTPFILWTVVLSPSTFFPWNAVLNSPVWNMIRWYVKRNGNHKIKPCYGFQSCVTDCWWVFKRIHYFRAPKENPFLTKLLRKSIMYIMSWDSYLHCSIKKSCDFFFDVISMQVRRSLKMWGWRVIISIKN